MADDQDDEKDSYEDLGPVISLHRTKAPNENNGRCFIFAFSEFKADGTIADEKFKVFSNLDGSMVIEFGEKSVDEGSRYVVRVRDVAEAAYRHHKARGGG